MLLVDPVVEDKMQLCNRNYMTLQLNSIRIGIFTLSNKQKNYVIQLYIKFNLSQST